MAVSLALLGLSLRALPLGTAYAVWTGIGALGTVLLGIVLFAESADAARLVCVGLILGGIIGLKLGSSLSPQSTDSQRTCHLPSALATFLSSFSASARE
jgi:hypothetical protein